MLKSILRLPQISRAARLDRRYLRSGGSGRNRLIEEGDDDVIQRIELKRGRIAPTDLMDDLDSDLNLKEKSVMINEELVENKFSYLQPVVDQRLDSARLAKLDQKQQLLVRSNRLENILVCKNAESLFRLIKPKLFELNAGEIRLVYEKLNEFLAKRKDQRQAQNWTQRSIYQSPVFRALQDHSDDLLADLDSACLAAMLETFSQLDFSPDQRMVRHTLIQLKARLDDFELSGLVNCLATLQAFVEKPLKADCSEMHRLIEKLFPIAKKRALKTSAGDEEPVTLVKCFRLFLNSPPQDPDRRVINHVISLLTAKETFVTYKQALDLLAGIEQSYRSCKERPLEPAARLGAMADLIEKCNFKIFKRFSNDPSDHFLNFYLASVHGSPTSTEFSRLVPNFYDETECRLLNTLTPFLHRKFANDERIKHLSFNFAVNHAKFNIFDEGLLKRIYDKFETDQFYRLNLNLRLFYGVMSKFRLPFVQHQKLVNKFLFCLSNQPKKQTDHTTQVSDYPGLLAELILNDALNEGLLNFLVQHLDEPSAALLEQVDCEDVDKMRLASAYLSAFCNLDEPLKSKVKAKLDQLLNDGLSNAPDKIERTTAPPPELQIDRNVQRNGRLSNGIRLQYFGIFDASGRSVPFDGYREHLDQIDRIPAKLESNQKLFAFVIVPRLRGNIQDYEFNYVYRLAKVLKYFAIQPIQIFENDLKSAFDSLKRGC